MGRCSARRRRSDAQLLHARDGWGCEGHRCVVFAYSDKIYRNLMYLCFFPMKEKGKHDTYVEKQPSINNITKERFISNYDEFNFVTYNNINYDYILVLMEM